MSSTISEAIAAMHRGDKGQARQMLAAIVQSEPDNEMAWMLLCELVEDSPQKEYCLQQALRINPANRDAGQRLASLTGVPAYDRKADRPASASEMQREGAPHSTPSEQVSQRSPMESVQCPKCGAPIGEFEGRDSVYCAHCGSRLRLTRGSSGHVLATLDDIKVDTSVMAKEATYGRLRTEVKELETELGKARAELQTAKTQPIKSHGSLLGATILAAVTYALVVAVGLLLPDEFGAAMLCIGGIPAIAVFAWVLDRASSSSSELRRKLVSPKQERVEQIEWQLMQTQQKVTQMKAGLDRTSFSE